MKEIVYTKTKPVYTIIKTLVPTEEWELYDIKGAFSEDWTIYVDYGDLFKFQISYNEDTEEYDLTLLEMEIDARFKSGTRFKKINSWHLPDEESVAKAIIDALDDLNEKYHTNFKFEMVTRREEKSE